MLKYFFSYNENNLNAPAVASFRTIIFDGIFFVMFLVEVYYGFRCTWFELLCGVTGGFLFSIGTYLVVYADSIGKVGVSDALIET